jgi:hypothetical protein
MQNPIALTKFEQNLFNFLKNLLKLSHPSNNIWVAGGWVRDKLLNIDSDDIDIVSDTLSGQEFVNLIEKMWSEPKLSELTKGFSGNPKDLSPIHAISEDAAHLGTASIKIHGWVIDFASFRHEEYVRGSRVPSKIESGNILQDCQRRDFTINSMYYNIMEQRIDDPSKRGITDIENKVIHMLKDADIALEEDPLRIPRAFRFGAKYGYEMNEDIVNAARKENVIEEWDSTVSKERLTKEILSLFKVIKMCRDIGVFFHGMVMISLMERTYLIRTFFESQKPEDYDSVYSYRREQSLKLLTSISKQKNHILKCIEDVFGEKEVDFPMISASLFLSVWLVPYYFEISPKKSLSEQIQVPREEMELLPHKTSIYPFFMQTMRLDKTYSLHCVQFFKAISVFGKEYHSKKQFTEQKYISDEYVIAKFLKSRFIQFLITRRPQKIRTFNIEYCFVII